MSEKDDEYDDSLDEREEQLVGRVRQLLDELAVDFADLGEGLRWRLTQTVIHQAIHFAAEREDVEFCSVATYLGEMIGHAHEVMHDSEPESTSHKFVH